MYNVYNAAAVLYTGNPRQIKTALILSGRSLSHRERVRIDNKLGVVLVFLLNGVNPKTLYKSKSSQLEQLHLQFSLLTIYCSGIFPMNIINRFIAFLSIHRR